MTRRDSAEEEGGGRPSIPLIGVCVCLFLCLCDLGAILGGRRGDPEDERVCHVQTETEMETHTERERQKESKTERETEKETEIEIDTYTDADT